MDRDWNKPSSNHRQNYGIAAKVASRYAQLVIATLAKVKAYQRTLHLQLQVRRRNNSFTTMQKSSYNKFIQLNSEMIIKFNTYIKKVQKVIK